MIIGLSIHKQDKGFVPQFCVTNPSEQLSSAEFYALFKPLFGVLIDLSFVVQIVPHFICSKLLRIKKNMNKNEKTTSIRFSPDIDTKISWLLDFDRENAKRTGIKPSNRTQIIEDAVAEYYYRKINKIQDADVAGRISMTVDDRVNASMNSLHSKIDEILFLCIKNDLGNKLLYRCPDFIKCPSDREKALDMITEEETDWDNALEEAMMYALENDIKDKDGK